MRGPTVQDAVPLCGSPPCPGRGDLRKPSSNLRAPVSLISISGTKTVARESEARALQDEGVPAQSRAWQSLGTCRVGGCHAPRPTGLGAWNRGCHASVLSAPKSSFHVDPERSGHPEALACRKVLAERRLGEGCSGGRLCLGPRSWNVR